MPTAIVTGASSGIGKGITCRLLQDGWNVVLIARSTEKMKRTVSGYTENRYKIISCDLSKPELLLTSVIPLIEAYLKQSGVAGIDLLVNNAGGVNHEFVAQHDSIEHALPSFNWSIALMLTSPYLMMKYLGQKDLYNDKAAVVNVGSIRALYGADNLLANYSVAKRGLESVTKCMALELADKNGKTVRVNNLDLGYTKTDILKQVNEKMPREVIDGYYDQMGKLHPLKRAGTVEDVVEIVLFLSDDKKSGWITGQSYVIDGGIGLRLFNNPQPKL